MKTKQQIMSMEHPQWNAFAALIYGPEGCDVEDQWPPPFSLILLQEWTCEGCQAQPDMPIARKLLAKHFPEIDVEATLVYFTENHAFCDCQILHNVDGRMGNCLFLDNHCAIKRGDPLSAYVNLGSVK